jgi:hypothetical protein
LDQICRDGEKLGSIFQSWNLDILVLVMIFRTPFSTEIGMKSLPMIGLSIYGIRVIKHIFFGFQTYIFIIKVLNDLLHMIFNNILAILHEFIIKKSGPEDFSLGKAF